MTAAERAARTESADALCVAAYDDCGGPEVGAALVAVGGYGRAELAPYSDLDVVLVSDEGVDLGVVAEKVWYPIWDSGSQLDHSVRTLPEMVTAADDLRVASGLLDIRHLAGDPNLTLRLRTTMLAHWRRGAKERLPELHQMVRSRHELIGELAHLSVPDLKESEGGLRDATMLKALVATWLVDVPHTDLERSRQALLDVRDLVHGIAGRATDRIAPEMWSELAAALETGAGEPGERAAQVHVRELGRRITHLSRLTWRRVDDVLTRPASVKTARRPSLAPLAPGSRAGPRGGGARQDRSPGRGPRAPAPRRDGGGRARRGAGAADRRAAGARVRPAARPVADRGPAAAGAAAGLRAAACSGSGRRWRRPGALTGFLPEWERIRLLPHASVIHRFTVDRHVVETCIEASTLIRAVSRPDVLMVAALLHDIGKGSLTEHSVAGEPVARQIATRMGFEPESVELIALLVRWHLLLAETATTRDPDDPATVDVVTSKLGSAGGALPARRPHRGRRQGHVAEGLVVVALGPDPRPRPAGPRVPGQRHLAAADGHRRHPDPRRPPPRLGLDLGRAGARRLAGDHDRPRPGGAAGRLRRDVRAAPDPRSGPRRVWSQGEHGISVWEVADEHLDAAILRTKFDAVAGGRVDPDDRLRRAARGGLAPTVVVRPEASDQATVLEVRASDRPGVVYLVCRALADLDVAVRSAHVDTLGPQAVDVFYLQEASAGALSETRAAEAAHAVREVLSG